MKIEVLEPVEGGKVVYQLLGRPRPGAKAQARVSVTIRITNDSKTPVKLTDVELQGMSLSAFGLPVELGAGKSMTMQNYRDDSLGRAALLLTAPFPSSLTIKAFAGDAAPAATVTVPAGPHTNDGGPLLWPGHAADLGPGEHWAASSDHGSDHQVFALDTAVRGWKGDHWSETYAGTPDWSVNREHYRVYGTPIYAMADGVVVYAITDHEERPTTKDAPTISKSLGTFSGGGNMLFVQTGDEVALYAHMQLGSIPKEVGVPGATVRRGQYLGKAGLSGSTSHPHLHVHVKRQLPGTTAKNKGQNADLGPYRPMTFSGAQVLAEEAAVSPTAKGWSTLSNQSLPHAYSLLHPTPSGPVPASPAADSATYLSVWRASSEIELRLPGQDWKSFCARWEQLSADSFRLTRVETSTLDGARRFHAVYRRGTFGHALYSLTGWEAFCAKWDELSKQGLRLVDLTSHPQGKDRQYIGVFHAGNDAHALISATGWDAFTGHWAELTSKGLRLVDVEMHGTSSGATQYVGAFRAGSSGHALLGLTGWKAFTAAWAEQTKKGLRLVAVDSLQVGSQRQYVGVFAAGKDGHALHAAKGGDAFSIVCEELNGKGLRMVDLDVF